MTIEGKHPGNNKDPADRRVFARFTADVYLRYANCSSLDSTRKKMGQTLDVSAQGIGMFTSERLGPDSKLDIWLKIPNTDKEIFTKGKVIWSKKIEVNKYKVGVDLENPELMGMSVVLRAINIHTVSRC